MPYIFVHTPSANPSSQPPHPLSVTEAATDSPVLPHAITLIDQEEEDLPGWSHLISSIHQEGLPSQFDSIMSIPESAGFIRERANLRPPRPHHIVPISRASQGRRRRRRRHPSTTKSTTKTTTQLKQVAYIVSVYMTVQMAVLTLVAQQPNPNSVFFFFCLVLPIATIPFILLCLALLLLWYIKSCLRTVIISMIVLLLGFQAAVLMYAYHVTTLS